MSRKRHTKRAQGGKTPLPYNAQGSNVLKEAEERKRGGRAHVQGEGEAASKRRDRPGRKRGGRIGADRMPLSSAARVKHVTKGEMPEEGSPSD